MGWCMGLSPGQGGANGVGTRLGMDGAAGGIGTTVGGLGGIGTIIGGLGDLAGVDLGTGGGCRRAARGPALGSMRAPIARPSVVIVSATTMYLFSVEPWATRPRLALPLSR